MPTVGGVPGNGQPVPDGAKMAKIMWSPKTLAAPGDATVPRPEARRFHGEGQQEVCRHRRTGLRPVRLRRPRPIGSRPRAPAPRTVVGPRAIPSRRRETTSSRSTARGEGREGLPTPVATRRARRHGTGRRHGRHDVLPAAAQQKIEPRRWRSTRARRKATATARAASVFEAPNGCKFVQGDISPQGWCQLFSRRPA